MGEIKDLRFDDKNFNKHTEFGMGTLEKSLCNYGAGRSILVDKDNNIIAGNGIAEVAGQIGLTKTKVVETTGDELVVVKRTDVSLDSEEGRGMALADNATAAADLNWDNANIIDAVDQFNLNPKDWLGNLWSDYDEPRDYYGDERERTYKSTNLKEFDPDRKAGKYDIPTIMGCTVIPDDLIGFNEVKTSKTTAVGVHCFIDDYQFERLWNRPKNYIDLLKPFQCFFTPDFSLYMDMPMAVKIWNVYRSRLIGQIMEDAGVKVIPTLSWAGADTFDFVFDGLPKNATYAVSTVGVKTDDDAIKNWRRGMDEAIKRLSPKRILLYGSDIDYDWKEVEIIKYKARQFNGV